MSKVKDHQIQYQKITSYLSGSRLGLDSDTYQTKVIGFLERHHLYVCLDFDNKLDVLPSLYHSLQDKKQQHTLHALKLTGDLSEIGNAIQQENTKVLAIKGPVLAQTLFGDVGKRQYGDLDLVIKREDLEKVIEVLEGMGYELRSPKKGLKRKQWDYYFRYKKDVILVNREKGVVVELHVGIYRHELLKEADEAMMFEDLEEVVIGGTPISTMNRENTFLYLLYHGGQHMYFRLFWLRDVAEAVKRWELDHGRILKKARQIGIERMVGFGLLLARDYFETEIPEAYQGYILEHENKLKKMEQMCIKRIEGPEFDTFLMKLQRYRFNLMLKPGLRYKWAVINTVFHRWYIRKFLGGH